MQGPEVVQFTLKESEMLSLIWILFYAAFTGVVYYYGDAKQNKNLIERVGAFIFSMVIAATYFGAMATQFFAWATDVIWYSKSGINNFIIVLSIIATWTIAFRGWLWLGGLFVTCLVAGGIMALIFRF